MEVFGEESFVATKTGAEKTAPILFFGGLCRRYSEGFDGNRPNPPKWARLEPSAKNQARRKFSGYRPSKPAVEMNRRRGNGRPPKEPKRRQPNRPAGPRKY